MVGSRNYGPVGRLVHGSVSDIYSGTPHARSWSSHATVKTATRHNANDDRWEFERSHATRPEG